MADECKLLEQLIPKVDRRQLRDRRQVRRVGGRRAADLDAADLLLTGLAWPRGAVIVWPDPTAPGIDGGVTVH